MNQEEEVYRRAYGPNIVNNSRSNRANNNGWFGKLKKTFKTPSRKMIMEEILPDVLDASVILTKMYKGITPTDVEFSKLLKYGSKWPNKMGPKDVDKTELLKSEITLLKSRVDVLEQELAQMKYAPRSKRNKAA
jgi:hypothetical protein